MDNSQRLEELKNWMGAAQVRRLLERPGLIRSLGAHDVLSGLVIERAGFETVFVGGFGTSASLLGLPDVNFLTMTEMADAVRRIARRVRIPVIADGNTGHGDLHNVMRTVEEFEGAGAAGILIEDQVFPKRCGHFEGKQVIPCEEMVLKIKAALRARSNPNFVLIARTDAREPFGLEEAIFRVRRYGEVGADVVFIEAPLSLEEVEVIPRRVEYPLLINMLTGGKTPILSVQELEQLGYKIAVYPIDSLLVTVFAVKTLAETLQKTGRTDGLRGCMASLDEVKTLLRLEESLSLRAELEGVRNRIDTEVIYPS